MCEALTKYNTKRYFLIIDECVILKIPKHDLAFRSWHLNMNRLVVSVIKNLFLLI